MKKHILFIGKGGHFNSISPIISKDYYDGISTIDLHFPLNKKNIIKNIKMFNSFYSSHKDFKIYIFISLGSNYLRFASYDFLKKFIKFKFFFAKLISDNAYIAKKVKIGCGSVILPGSIINANSIIGSHSIINTNSSIDHDCKIASFTSLAPGVSLGGGVSIGKFSHLGIGSSVNHNIKIGKNVVIGGGSFINKNCISNSTYFGVPGKFINKRLLTDLYL